LSKLNENRRNFIKTFGALGASIPFLPSLLSMSLNAQDTLVPKRFVFIRTAHGSRKENWDPGIKPPELLGKDIRSGSLQELFSSTQLNKLIDTNFNQYLNQLTYIKGLDIPIGIGHNYGGALGHYSTGDGYETIDQLLARSSKFYQGVTPVIDSLIFSSYGFCSYMNQNGSLKPRSGYSDPSAAFDLLFNLSKSSNLTKSGSAIDIALKRFEEIKKSNKLSSADKKILENQMFLLNEMGVKLKKIKSVTTPQNPIPTGTLTLTQRYEAFVDVGVLALFNNLTNILVINIEEADGVGASTWHSASHDSETQLSPNHYKASYWAAQKVFLRLIKKMSDITEANGRTLLDNSLVFWGGEMSQGAGHVQENMPVILAGSAQGFIKPGQFLDYSQYDLKPVPSNNMGDSQYMGRSYNQLLNTILQSMGLNPADYEKNGQSGYGQAVSASLSRNLRYKDIISEVGNVLPKIRG